MSRLSARSRRAREPHIQLCASVRCCWRRKVRQVDFGAFKLDGPLQPGAIARPERANVDVAGL